MDLNNSLLKSLPVYHFTTNHGNCKEEVYRWASSALSLFFSCFASPLEEPLVVERFHNIPRDSE